MQAGLVDRAPNAGSTPPSPPGQDPLIHAKVAGVAAVAGEHRRRRLVSMQGREGGREVCVVGFREAVEFHYFLASYFILHNS